MSHLLNTLLDLDENCSSAELFNVVQHTQYRSIDMLLAIRELLSTTRLRFAYMLAMMLVNAGHNNIILSMAMCAGGLVFHNREDEQRGRLGLQAEVDKLTTKQQAQFYDHVVFPVSKYLLEPSLSTMDHERILRILEISKAADPPLRTLFDWTAPIPELNKATLQSQGHTRAKLLNHTSPPENVPSRQRSVLVTGRKTFFQIGPNSRLCDVGPRIMAAMNQYGWQAELYSMEVFISDMAGSDKEFCIIAERCRQQKPDILLLEDEILFGNRDAYRHMLGQIRVESPATKIVGYRTDSWETRQSLSEISPLLDLVWDFTSPIMHPWEDPKPAYKQICIPCPFVWDHGSTEQPLATQMVFSGSIKGFNWHRAFWMSAVDRLQLPVIMNKSTHFPDDFAPLVSYGHYMQGLKEATCCLSLTMRPDRRHSRIIAGRCFEVLLSGSLLVQEKTPDLDYFFIPGEHYLEFNSIVDLQGIVQFIHHNKEAAEEIRRNGHAFARQHYHDRKLVSYLDKALFYPNHA